MTVTELQSELFSQLAEPIVVEALFDYLPDLVFFVKNHRGEYVIVNQTLVERCGRREKRELIGRRANEVFPSPMGETYAVQDKRVLGTGEGILNQLELHFYPSGAPGWCLTNKLPLHGRGGKVVGLVGISKDLLGSDQRTEDYSPIATVIHYINAHYDEPLRVPDLAAKARLSEYQFEQRIRKIFQVTAGQLIQKTRMEHAIRRLRETEDQIAVIALDCGYSDQSAFTRQFRQTTGLSPSKYRRTFGKQAH